MDARYLRPEQRYLSLDSCVEMKQLIEVTTVSSSSSSSTAALCCSVLLVVVVVVVAILLNTRNTRQLNALGRSGWKLDGGVSDSYRMALFEAPTGYNGVAGQECLGQLYTRQGSSAGPSRQAANNRQTKKTLRKLPSMRKVPARLDSANHGVIALLRDFGSNVQF